MLSHAYFGLILFIIFIEFHRKRKLNPDFLTLFHIVFLLLYPIPGLFLDADIGNSRVELNMTTWDYKGSVKTLVAVFIGYFSVILGFYSKSAENNGRSVIIKSRSNNSVVTYALILLVISFLSIYLYSLQFGGVLNALTNATYIRSNLIDSGPYVFFKHFMFYSLMSSYLLIESVFFTPKHRYKVILTTVFILSFIMTFIATSITAGRALFIYYLVVFCLIYALKTKQFLSLPLIIIMCFSGAFILFGKQFFWSLSGLNDGLEGVVRTFNESSANNESSSSSIYKILANFAYPIHSLDAAFTNNYEMRLFIDLIYGIVSFLPERILNIAVPDTISYFNTNYIAGTTDYEIPVAFLAFGIYSLSWPGLVVVAFLYGWVGRYLETVLYQHIYKINWVILIYPLTAIIWIDFQPAGDPRVFLMNNFWAYTSIFGLLFVVSKTSTV
jgi:hypothetical protein